MKELLEYLVRALIKDQDALTITEKRHEGKNIIEIRVSQEDMGRVIGKGGKTASAIRTLVNATATQSSGKTIIKFTE